ncbi:imidazole glycerol phosphate synthase subunit HisH 2 [Spirochaetia bacterium]|nr:imidazole glycerol phosphate synthase subunit HisH 2 [Spirochaetia bacterium]
MVKVGIISVDMGNVASIKNMIYQIGIESDLLRNPIDSIKYDWIILPGVGAYDNGINKLKESGWFDWLKENQSKNDNKSNVLGICLGMQLLCDGSEEGNLTGLGIIPGYFKRFHFEAAVSALKIPHMCWNNAAFNESKIEWGKQINKQNPRYYFVHSYHYTNDKNDYIIGTTNYGYDFASAIKRDNVIGFQFHPEKSHKYGKSLLSELFI